jgi:DNA-3-methyladenine glycosylase I
VGRRPLPRHLPAARLRVRPRHREAAEPARIRAGRDLSRPGRGRHGQGGGRIALVVRCWQSADPAYDAYHDEEWGRPVRSEQGIYERLCLEGFQSGLSWLTILRKREGFRSAFAAFDPDTVAGFGERDVERLLGDAGIVRHRGKIEAAIGNARATVALRKEVPLHELLWSYAPERHPVPQSQADWSPSTPESAALSKLLKKVGFRFVGPTTVYAAMQACGVVNDHLATCHVRAAVEGLRRPS